MTVISARSRRLRSSVWAAAVVLVVAMLGRLTLSAPPAAANCALTSQDDQYIQLLAQNTMTHRTDANDCDVAAEGRSYADQVRQSADPLGTARSLVHKVAEATSMNEQQAEWEIESAVFVYAPEMIPLIKNQLAQQPPE